jgi:hypothetical protein
VKNSVLNHRITPAIPVDAAVDKAKRPDLGRRATMLVMAIAWRRWLFSFSSREDFLVVLDDFFHQLARNAVVVLAHVEL